MGRERGCDGGCRVSPGIMPRFDISTEPLDQPLGKATSMSSIDTSKHLRIGMLSGVPIYQLLEDNHSLTQRNGQGGHRMPEHFVDSFVPAGAIVIGGGSGEHPALALYDPDHCVARYLHFCLDFDSMEIPPELESAWANMQGALQTLEYCEWQSQDHVDFRRRCFGLYEVYKDEMTFEAWILVAVGDFLFQLIPNYSPQIRKWHAMYHSDGMYCLNAICVPYDSYGGNGRDRFRVVDTEEETV